MWVWRYVLRPKRVLSALAGARPREGALLRVGDGFADIHPWPELGDAPLAEQLARLARGETTPLTKQSLAFAELDAAARHESRSLFDGRTIPRSHWPGDDPPDAFDTVKLKHVDRIPDRVRLRLDFNAMLTAAEFLTVAERLPKERVDFVEDPFPYDPLLWLAVREETGLRFALDRGEATTGVDVLVVKPAVQPLPKSRRELVVTSYMDHPIGQFFAAYVAAPLPGTHGLFTHVLYERDEFIEQIRSDGARLLPPERTGIGFDDLLARLPWKRLA